MIAAAVAAVVTFIVIGVVMSRQTKQRKNAAIEDLQREKKEVGKTDIFAIVSRGPGSRSSFNRWCGRPQSRGSPQGVEGQQRRGRALH